MKRIFATLIAGLTMLAVLGAGCNVNIGNGPTPEGKVSIDFYSINDLHGKFLDSDSQPGVDNLTTYLKRQQQTKDNVVLLSAGDMWQGSVESNKTRGAIMTEWMNELSFVSMTYGNHEFDWGADYIRQNQTLADFPFLALNIYDRETDTLADYCTPSVTVKVQDITVGIIGSIGDCYSSISAEKTTDIYFKTGKELTSLVKAESNKLKKAGVDFIVYATHDSFDAYDNSLSDGYVDLVFEGHSHSTYVKQDSHGVYHLQGGGENKGISHASVLYDRKSSKASITAETIANNSYSSYDEDPLINKLMEKYADTIGDPQRKIGYNAEYRDSGKLCRTVAQLYYEAGIQKWGEQYDIVLGGGFLKPRSPYNLYKGDVTYAMLNSLFPFDNIVQLCTVSGKSLRDNFFFTSNTNYYTYYGDYGRSVMDNIKLSGTYYIVVDSYTSQYAPNKLTVVEDLSADITARELLEDYISAGNWAH